MCRVHIDAELVELGSQDRTVTEQNLEFAVRGHAFDRLRRKENGKVDRTKTLVHVCAYSPGSFVRANYGASGILCHFRILEGSIEVQ
jgi:hypothetical protein